MCGQLVVGIVSLLSGYIKRILCGLYLLLHVDIKYNSTHIQLPILYL